MRTPDICLLLAVTGALILMAVLVLSPGEVASVGGGARAPGEGPEAELPGEARDLDVERIRRRILRGDLSDREALFYHREPVR